MSDKQKVLLLESTALAATVAAAKDIINPLILGDSLPTALAIKATQVTLVRGLRGDGKQLKRILKNKRRNNKKK